MEEWVIWIIIFLLVLIVSNQARERQDRETKRMTKKEREKYFADIKEKQEKNTRIAWWIVGIILALVLLFLWAIMDGVIS